MLSNKLKSKAVDNITCRLSSNKIGLNVYNNIKKYADIRY